MIRAVGLTLHRCIAVLPLVWGGYFWALSMVGPMLSRHRRAQVVNSLQAVAWGDRTFAATEIQAGLTTRYSMYPHAGELDFECALGGCLSYESEVFTFLDSRLDSYDAVVDIGANVGVFSLFLAKRQAGCGKVYAFARQLSRTVKRTPVPVLAADLLSSLLDGHSRCYVRGHLICIFRCCLNLNRRSTALKYSGSWGIAPEVSRPRAWCGAIGSQPRRGATAFCR
jgi:hypothetical protein